MALLSIVQFAAFAASCAPQVAAKDLVALAHVESGLETLALHDNTDRKSYRPSDKTEALTLAKKLLDAGHSIDVGLLQINSANFGWLNLTLDDAFEPCSSIKAGAEVLTAYSRYNTGSPTRGFSNGYVARVIDASSDRPARTVPPAPLDDANRHRAASPLPPVKPQHEAQDWNIFAPSNAGASDQSFFVLGERE